MSFNQKIIQAERILDYTFNDKLLCIEAIQMSGPKACFVYNERFRMVRSNKRLAILGDTVLVQVLCKMCLAGLGDSPGLGRVIFTNEGHVGTPGVNMIATTFEAIMAAVYQDGGQEARETVIDHVGLGNHPTLLVTSE
ncbi:hypothetical protein N0V90_007141 [Kalmusia sp. IMI 367209]|nr:hypothetical protein N0V90_007141 [Kalmusia sp. IMI 367209]